MIMSKLNVDTTLKRLRNTYRLVIINEDSFEEEVSFKLSRTSVYIALSSIFILLTALTAALIAFTPLKYYLPGVGYGNNQQLKEYRALKIRMDSVENALKSRQVYINNIEKVLQGNFKPTDSTTLVLPKIDTVKH
jgi:hypothetical protein